MIEQLGGRKFLFALLVSVLGFVLVLTKSLTSQEYLKFLEVVGATYVLGNVVSKFAPETK